MDTETELLHGYATAAATLYGVLSLGELVEIVNHYEKSNFKMVPYLRIYPLVHQPQNCFWAWMAQFSILAMSGFSGSGVLPEARRFRISVSNSLI